MLNPPSLNDSQWDMMVTLSFIGTKGKEDGASALSGRKVLLKKGTKEPSHREANAQLRHRPGYSAQT